MISLRECNFQMGRLAYDNRHICSKNKKRKKEEKELRKNIKIYTKMSGKVNAPRLVTKNMTK